MRHTRTCQLLVSATLFAAVWVSGCGSNDDAQGNAGSGATGGSGGSASDADPPDAGPDVSNESGQDATEPDTSVDGDTPDTSVEADTPDTSVEADTPDTSVEADTPDAADGSTPDADDADGSTPDADDADGSTPDADDADGSTPDADSADALDALTDGEVLDADASDGSVDATEESDTGTGSGGVWVEIDYSSAYTSQSPAWDYSATPGWGEAQWAPDGWTRPEAWDRFNNMIVEWDPMGSKALTIGSSSELQLMIGLEELTSYSHATVRLEGRSRATSSSVHFNVVNPINGCSVSGSMSNDWTIHVEELDFGQCLVPGAGLQAVRVDPTSGTLALVRMRVTLHDAQW
jgi:hypothetical protein